MSFIKDLPKSERRKVLAKLSNGEKDRILEMLAKYIYKMEEREKKLKELFKI